MRDLSNCYDKNCIEVRLRSSIVCPWSLVVLKRTVVALKRAGWVINRTVETIYSITAQPSPPTTHSRQHLLQQHNLHNAHAEVIIVRHSGIAGLYSEPINWQNGVEISSLRDASIYCGAVLRWMQKCKLAVIMQCINDPPEYKSVF